MKIEFNMITGYSNLRATIKNLLLFFIPSGVLLGCVILLVYNNDFRTQRDLIALVHESTDLHISSILPFI